MCPVNNQSLVLGVLVDLCENPKVNTDCVYVCMRLHVHVYVHIHVHVHVCTSTLVHMHVMLQAIPHVVAWGGRETNMSSWSLLAYLWRQEETDMGVPRGDAGTLAGQIYTTHSAYIYVYRPMTLDR